VCCCPLPYCVRSCLTRQPYCCQRLWQHSKRAGHAKPPCCNCYCLNMFDSDRWQQQCTAGANMRCCTRCRGVINPVHSCISVLPTVVLHRPCSACCCYSWCRKDKHCAGAALPLATSASTAAAGAIVALHASRTGRCLLASEDGTALQSSCCTVSLLVLT
jgi:hypothetical protein